MALSSMAERRGLLGDETIIRGKNSCFDNGYKAILPVWILQSNSDKPRKNGSKEGEKKSKRN
ncbi:MAG TPA: hypothetical protein DCM71_00065 [Runella sp.]|nr:hypothetical protein [Runella sp.]